MSVEHPKTPETTYAADFQNLAIAVSAFRRIGVWQIPRLIEYLGLDKKQLMVYTRAENEADLPFLLCAQLNKLRLIQPLSAESDEEWELLPMRKTKDRDNDGLGTNSRDPRENFYATKSNDELMRLFRLAHEVGWLTEVEAIRHGIPRQERTIWGIEEKGQKPSDIATHFVEAVYHLYAYPDGDEKARGILLRDLLDLVMPVELWDNLKSKIDGHKRKESSKTLSKIRRLFNEDKTLNRILSQNQADIIIKRINDRKKLLGVLFEEEE